MKLSENRFCPECGEARAWDFGFRKHTLHTAGGAVLNITHVKFENQPGQYRLLMASILVNGKAQTLETLDELRAVPLSDLVI